ncbi:hypothetical protein GWK47_027841 [Chionoecetes opilio]|uniref:Uncharacterized protein n=1 Tax=Chionoecetes opilio TaxID=41210 RepID=A0A8J8W910_CHIOP|nr:hypothetical protein GWK47_027841 [Chionoecetes opilio]
MYRAVAGEGVFAICMGPSSGPDIGVFTDFKKRGWPFSTRASRAPPTPDTERPPTLLNKREPTSCRSCAALFNTSQPAGTTTSEMLDASSSSCWVGRARPEGEVPATGRHATAPRWMARAIYLRAANIRCFRRQLGELCSPRELSRPPPFTCLLDECLLDPLVRGLPWPPSRRRIEL